jgi:predicted SAM-dependent methyltransferase
MRKQLNLGCSNILEPKDQGWINLDIRGPWDNVPCDVVADVKQLPFLDNVFDHLEASNILEHIPKGEVHKVLIEWYRVLKVNGTLRATVPDFRFAVTNYIKGVTTIDRAQDVFGGQDSKYDFHYVGFDEPYLTRFLTNAGYKNIINETCPKYGGLQLLGHK